MKELINKNINFLKNYPIFKDNNNLIKKIVEKLNKDRVVIITAMRGLHKTSLIKELIERTGTRNYLYYNDEIDVENKIKNEKDFLEYIELYEKEIGKINIVILQNVNKINNLKFVISKLYKNETLKIIILSNNIHIDGKEEIEIYNNSFDEYSDKNELENKLLYGNLDEMKLLTNDFFKRNFLENIKNKIVLKDIINNYSIKSDFLFNYILTKISLLNKSLSIRELHRSIENDGVDISLVTLMDYIDYSVNAKIIKRCYSYDNKLNKSISTKVRFYFTDIGIRNIYSGFNTPKKAIIENIIYNDLITKYTDIYNGINGRFDFSFYIKDNDSIIDIFLEDNKNEVKKEIGKILKIDNNGGKTLILFNLISTKLKEKQKNINIINLSDYK